jgi:hypothetical protein
MIESLFVFGYYFNLYRLVKDFIYSSNDKIALNLANIIASFKNNNLCSIIKSMNLININNKSNLLNLLLKTDELNVKYTNSLFIKTTKRVTLICTSFQ